MSYCVFFVCFSLLSFLLLSFFFFFNDTATTEIYTLSLHDALPISCLVISPGGRVAELEDPGEEIAVLDRAGDLLDRKSTRLNSSHTVISYAVFCLKKKKKKKKTNMHNDDRT